MKLLHALFNPEPAFNATRYDAQPGHVESYFVRLNDPVLPRALWLKATIFAPLNGPAVSEHWFIWFDGTRNVTRGYKETVTFNRTQFNQANDRFDISVGGLNLVLGPQGKAEGHLTAPWGKASYALTFSVPSTRLAAPLSLYPNRLLREGPLPRFKVNTPFPQMVVQGTVTIGDETLDVKNWSASQGHNYGPEHYHRYAWGQVAFPRAGNTPETFVECGSGQLRLRGRVTPLISVLVVRQEEREFRFDTAIDLWRQSALLKKDAYVLAMRNAQASARVTFDATGKPTACLGYQNPDGTMMYCLNSKLAAVHLEVEPAHGPAFALHSPHAGALEFLSTTKDARFEVI